MFRSVGCEYSANVITQNGPGGVPRDACSAVSKQRVWGSWLGIARKSLGIPRTEKWPKMAHADDSVYCDWVYQSRFLGRGSDEALFSEKKGFSVKRGEAIQ